MGNPKKSRKKYSTPSHPWQKERIEEEKKLLKEYGLKNKKEIWKESSLLKNFAKQAKRLIVEESAQAEIEKSHLLKKLFSFGLVEKGAKLEDVLSLTLRNILERRLQTLVYKKKLAKSVDQARQFIVHRHVIVSERKITMPSYIVSREEEAFIGFVSKSPLFNQDHPERVQEAVVAEKPKKTEEKKEAKSTKAKKEEKPEKTAKTTEKKVPKKETKKEKKKSDKKDAEKPKEEKKEASKENKEGK